MAVLLRLDLVCATVYPTVYCSVICKEHGQSRQFFWLVINVGEEETGAKNGPLKYTWSDSDSSKGGTGTVDYNCLVPIAEEVGNPCDGGALDAVALELVDKQAAIHPVERLSKIQDYDVVLPSTLQIGRQFFYKLKELDFTWTPPAKAMLIVIGDAVGLKVLHDGADYDVLYELAYDTCKGDWPVVSRVVLLAFLEYGCKVWFPLVCWNNACWQRRLEDNGQSWR